MTGPTRERCIAALRCPVCLAALAAQTGVLRCVNGHAFDIAREGYVNLLPAGHGRSGRSGDPAGMIRARARFLDRGHYDALADAIDTQAEHALAGHSGRDAGRPATIVDAGCGTGHYLARIARGPVGENACLLGFDISRDAVRVASRRLPGALFFVNDVKHRLSLADGAADVLLDVFAPRNAGEFARVLRPGGTLIVVLPTEDHLHELRARLPLLDVGPEKEMRLVELFGAEFDAADREIVRRQSTLAPDDVADLLRMTPSAWHLPEGAWQDAAQLGEVRVTLGFIVRSFVRRRAGAASAE